jgi:hypothetical protein
MLRSGDLHTYKRWRLIASALLASAVVPAALIGILFLDAAIVPFVFVVALLHAICLGLPLYLYLDGARRITLLSAAGFGFCIGALPLPIFGLITQTGWDLSVTLARFARLFSDWNEFWGEALFMLILGALGAAAASVFVAIARKGAASVQAGG